MMDTIIDALVEAGYFRACISTLSDFDKIIGGMAWAMQLFIYDINIDIFYADTLDLGQKIALTERLVMVLLVMKCPHQIEPHQIVGLDYENLLPVIRWLIQRSAEKRREHEAFSKLLALRHFYRITKSKPDATSTVYRDLQSLDSLKKDSPNTSEVADTDLGEEEKRDIALFRKKLRESKPHQQVTFTQSARPNVETKETVIKEDDDGLVQVGQEWKRSEFKAEDIIDANFESVREFEEQEVEISEVANEGIGGLSGPSGLSKELDLELLATNQKILNLLKKLDSMPNQLEIDQYQKRYIELHQQLITKNKDLKKLYALFNSLDSTKHYLMKEINLLDSIMTNLDLTENSATNRFEFLKQFQDIIAKIQTVRDDVVLQLESVKARCNALSKEYTELLR